MSSQKLKSQTSSSEVQNEQKPADEAPAKATIGDYHTAPAYMKDNQHITHGYRINFDSPRKIFKSLFMVHNESVNIWSHFLPALIICVAIISFALFVDHQEFSKDLSSYKKDISESFDHYMHALDNMTLIQEMKHVRDQTQTEFQQLRRNALESFGKFTEKMNENMVALKSNLQLSVHDMQESAKQKFYNNFEKFQQMKNDYEHIIAPALIDQINSLNNSYINNIKEKIALFKQEIDSQDFSFIDFLHKNSPNPQHISRWPLMVFLFSAFVCLMCSTFFHLFYPMSSKSYVIFSRFDYAGISLLIAGSSFPPLYYGMYCYLEVALVYEIIIMTFAISIFILSVFEWMHRPQNVKFKAAIYGGFGLFNIIPVSHLLINDLFFDNGDKFSFASSLHYYVLLGFCYLFGLYIYTVRYMLQLFRCPERHYPGKFNLCGHSHQIWHMFVVLGIVFTYFGAMENFEMRKESACPIPQLL